MEQKSLLFFLVLQIKSSLNLKYEDIKHNLV